MVYESVVIFDTNWIFDEINCFYFKCKSIIVIIFLSLYFSYANWKFYRWTGEEEGIGLAMGGGF